MPSAIVVGGGIAGIACALALSDRGVRVTLLEASRRLGGRAASHVDPETGQEIDNCQHVTMGACTAYNSLLDRLGVGDAIEWTASQAWFDGEAGAGEGGARGKVGARRGRQARASVIEPGGLPPPLHYAGSFTRARFLSALDKAAIAGAIGLIATARREAWQGRTFLEFLEHAGQPPNTIERFWTPVVVSACNVGVERVSASPALMVFQQGLLAGPPAARIGVPRVPLGRLYARVEEELATRGGRLVLGARVERVIEIDGGAEVRLAADRARASGVKQVADASTLAADPAADTTGAGGDGETLMGADAAIVAVPPARVLGLLEGRLWDALGALDGVEHSAILGIHLRADRPVLSVPHAVLVGRETQWVFRKDASGRRVHAVISAAPDRVLAMSEDQIARMVWEDVGACIPAARDARLEWWRVIKNRQATFAATPAFEGVRPVPGPIVAGSRVALAGDYTRTGWPATMESAARSGRMAADALASLWG